MRVHGCMSEVVRSQYHACFSPLSVAETHRMPRRVLGAAAVLTTFMMFILLGIPTVAHAYRGESQTHVVVDPQTNTLTNGAKAFIEDYELETDMRWRAVGRRGLKDAVEVGKGLLGEALPLAGRAVPIVAGVLTTYELCSAFVHKGCWLFERDDRGVRPGSGVIWQHVSSVGPDGLPFGAPAVYPPVPALAGKRDIFVAQWNGGPYWFHDTRNAPIGCIAYGPSTFDFGGPTTVYSAPTGTNQFSCWIAYRTWSAGYPATVFWRDAQQDLTLRAPAPDDPAIPNVVWSNSQPGNSNWPSSVAAKLTTRQRDAICWLMRPDLCENPYTVAVPECAGVTEETCTNRLRDAGFTGTITPDTLSTDDAVMEQDANRVTATSPAVETDIDSEADITVYVNPETMPEMTAVETAIAETLKAKNPDTVTEENKKTIARECVRRVTREDVGGQATDCASLPVFVTGNDAAEPATNDRAALIRRPTWVLLHHRSTRPRTAWYDNQPGCVDGQAPPDFLDPQCHEFPFWSTMQAHNGAFNTGPGSLTPSIKWTPRVQNQRQGGALGHFFSSNVGGTGPTSYPFDGCDIPVADETPLPQMPGWRELAALPSAFLNVPLGARVPFKTVGFCNPTTAP
jgi:hypothetical protein